ncbi:U3 small nucleolar RNA-associated protein 5 [Histoplasma ohiense]|nr:U3 small nucleolar RNA-associated protein 5 [Histoplasma ohiense (nom. inval.)]
MGIKKASRGPVSKISSAAAPSASPPTLSANKSSILRSAFSPSEYQLALFASVIQGLDSQHLRVHEIGSGCLQCEHAVNPREAITSLDWGFYGDSHHRDRDQHMKKKRKRGSSGVNGIANADGGNSGNVVIAFGTSTSDIRMYSPAEDRIVGTLSGGHEKGIRDFKFTVNTPAAEGWSIGGDGKLVQWDLKAGRSIRVISLPSASVSALARPVPSNPPILCASQTPYLIGLEQEGIDGVVSFSAMKNSIHTLIPSSTDMGNLSEQFLASDSDRYINIFDLQKQKISNTLVAGSEIECLAFYPASQQGGHAENNKKSTRSNQLQKQLLAAITHNGVIELFPKPFHQVESLGSAHSLKPRGKAMTRRAEAVIKIVRPDKSRTAVPAVSASFQGPDLVVAWVEGGVNLVFERIRWQDEDTEELMFQGEKEIVRGKSISMLGSTMMNGVKHVGRTQVDESHTVVEQGGAAENIPLEDESEKQKDNNISNPSDDDEEDSNEEDVEDEMEAEKEEAETPKKASASATSHTQQEDINMMDADAEEGGEPSFGELVRAHAAEPIDVEAELDDADADADVDTRALSSTANKPNTTLQLPAGISLATVLSQALKTSDNTLLESCFHTTDMNIVRATIQRIDSSLAATLLQKLAERLSTRPGRYGHLLVWVQWTCIAHGGSIAGRPEVLRKMTALFKVMDQRSASLSSLLLLKGKLDMLDAQLGLRRNLQRTAGAGSRGRGSHGTGVLGSEEDDDEEDVIYVEGEEDLVDSGDEESGDVRRVKGSAAAIGVATTAAKRGVLGEDFSDGAEDEEDEDMPLALTGVASGDDEEDEDKDGEAEGSEDEEVELFDDEADESEDGKGADEEEDDEEEDEDEDEGSSMADFIAGSEEDESVDDDEPAPVPSLSLSSKRVKSKLGKSRR